MGELGRHDAAGTDGTRGSGDRPAHALLEALRPWDADKIRLLDSLSHQLRTPLTSALGYLELLGDGALGPLTAEQQRVLQTVADSVARLSAYIDELDGDAVREAVDREAAPADARRETADQG